jgi:hypothetical protein
MLQLTPKKQNQKKKVRKKEKKAQPKDPPETHPSEWWYTIIECTFGLHKPQKVK